MPSELTHLIIHDFEIYLKTVVSLRSNSATKTLKFFKTVVIFAQKCGVMTHDPFLNHHFHMEPVDRGFLTDEEIQRIMQKDFEIPRLEMVVQKRVVCHHTALLGKDDYGLEEFESLGSRI